MSDLTPAFKAELRAILASLDVDCDADTFSQNYQAMWKGLGAALDEVEAKDAEIAQLRRLAYFVHLWINRPNLTDQERVSIIKHRPGWERFVDGAVPLTARHISEWHEDIGEVLWWTNPVVEAPYVGSPLDCGRSIEVVIDGRPLVTDVGGWPGYHEWWTPLPGVPEFPATPRTAAPTSATQGVTPP